MHVSESGELAQACFSDKDVVVPFPIVAFDTETTGLDRQICVELYFVRLDCSGNIVAEKDCILAIDPSLHPDGRCCITDGAASVHGITEERRGAEGVEPLPVLLELLKHMKEVESLGGAIVGHNLAYDLQCISNTLELFAPRPDDPSMLFTWQVPVVDTMLEAHHMVLHEFNSDTGSFIPCLMPRRRPKLVELCHHLGFEYDLSLLHGARADTILSCAAFCAMQTVDRCSLPTPMPLLMWPGMHPLFDEDLQTARTAVMSGEAAFGTELQHHNRCDAREQKRARLCEQGTDAWLRARRAVTGSTVGTIMGLNPYQSSVDCAAEKLGPSKLLTNKAAMNYGTFFEDLAQYLYEQYAAQRFHSVRVTNVGTIILDEPYQHVSVSPDGLIDLQRKPDMPTEHGILEIKCPGWGTPFDQDGAPMKISLLDATKTYYYAQVQLPMWASLQKKSEFLHEKPRTFAHFVFLCIDGVDLPHEAPCKSIAFPDFDRFCRDKCQIFNSADIIDLFEHAYVATKSGERFFLPFTAAIGANHLRQPLVFFLDGNELISVKPIKLTCVPGNFDKDEMGYTLAEPGDPDPGELRDILFQRPDDDADGLARPSFLENNRRTVKYLRSVCELNRMNHSACKTKKDVQALLKKALDDGMRIRLPKAASRAIISVTEYAYDPEFCVEMERRFQDWHSRLVMLRLAQRGQLMA
jgi:putative phage-type endonuclease